MGLRLGAERFYDYLDAFGVGSATGVDVPGEAGGIVKRETPIRSCKVALFCEKCNKGVRVGYKMDGDKKVRICRKCGAEI